MYSVNLPGYVVDEVEQIAEQVVIKAHSSNRVAACPHCKSVSHRVHSHYTRQPRDLPMLGQKVRLQITTRRFICEEPTCPKKTFAEQHPQFLPRYARRTVRFTQQVSQVALASNALQGASLSASRAPD